MPVSLRSLLAALTLCLAACGGGGTTHPDGGGGGTDGGSGPPPNPRTDWTNGAVVYELFVRSFQDSDGDGKGDLKGLISRLDYLNDGDPNTTTDLGVDAIWLMPVFKSPSYHGYDITDYESINPDYGTDADFQQLVSEAHKRGIKVIVDFVMNHTSSQHPWFLDSASSTTAAKRSWYLWSQTDLGWRQPWGGTGTTWHLRNGAYYYGVFWDGMPDLNYRSAEVRAEMKRLAALWLSRGVDGFRLDAARYLVEDGGGDQAQDRPDTHAYWKEWAASVRALKPDVLIVGEVWADTTTIGGYYGSTATVPGGDELPLNFDFPLASTLISGVNASDGTRIAAQLKVEQASYAPGATAAPFLSNHDMTRVASQLTANPGREKNAAALLLTVPGTAFIYYGEEVGALQSTGSGDEAKRAPMAWNSTATGGFTTGSPWYAFASNRDTNNVATQSQDPNSLLSRYRKLIHARKASGALTKGGLQLLTPTSGASETLAFLRVDGDETVLVVHNLSDSYANAGPFSLSQSSNEALFQDDGAALTGGAGAWRVSLPGRGTGIWRMK